MRKMSEILKFGMDFYFPATGKAEHSEYMCYALCAARDEGWLTNEDVHRGQQFCMAIVDSLNARRVSLYAAVSDVIWSTDQNGQEPDMYGICYMIYEAVIDKLESQDL